MKYIEHKEFYNQVIIMNLFDNKKYVYSNKPCVNYYKNGMFVFEEKTYKEKYYHINYEHIRFNSCNDKNLLIIVDKE